MIQLNNIIPNDNKEKEFNFGLELVNGYSVIIFRHKRHYTVDLCDIETLALKEYRNMSYDEVNEVLRALQEPYTPKDEREFNCALNDLLNKNNIEILKN